MAASNLKTFALFALLTAPQGFAAAAPAHPARPAQEAISLDAQSFEADLQNNTLIYRKVRIAQGMTTVSADLGQTTNSNGKGLTFDNSLWVFRANVKITTQDSQLTSEDAEITFAKKALARAVASGKPAAFEQRVAKTGKVAHGRADTIDYDAVKGVVLLSKNAWLTDGQTEISNDTLKYNVLTQSIIAEGSDQGSQRVHIIITPPPSKP
jgi:lipopolysaccharide transport protein LptA